MKKILPLLLLASCASPSGSPAGSGLSDAEFETQMASVIQFDPALVRAGEKVVYFVKRQGENQTQTHSLAAVGEEGAALWIERKVPHDAGFMVVKSKIDRTGKLLEQWVGEPGGSPGKTYPHPRKSEEPPVRRDSSGAKADSKNEPDSVVLGGKTYTCTRVTTVLNYPDGRRSTMVNWFSKEVPFPASSELGGLVKRQFGRLTMDLAFSSPTGAQPDLMIK